MVSEAGTRINAFSSTKNVVMKWGIYPVEDRGISVEQMCDRACAAHAVSKAGMEHILRPMMMSCAASCCGSRRLQTEWKRPPVRGTV